MVNESRNYSLDEVLIIPPRNSKEKPISLGSDGTVLIDFEYRESILSETITCKVTFSDIGQYLTSDGTSKTVMEGMPLQYGEDVNIRFKDLNHNVTLNLKMQIRNATQIYKDTTKSLVTLDLVSPEAILSYKKPVKKRYDGKISDTIKSILTDKELLNTKKNIDGIEETFNSQTFIGNQRRPFYFCKWLACYSVPTTQKASGNTAGFFFFETSNGFQFKSIDKMFSPEGKQIKSFAYNQTPNTSTGYYGKILELEPPSPGGDLLKKLEAGTYSTRTILFDPFTCYYEVINPNSYATSDYPGSEKNLVKGGKNLPKINPKFNVEGKNKDFSRTKYYVLDTGTLPSGDVNQQISKSKTQNFDPKNVLNQSTMRYNQFFSSKTEITLYGDFSLHAGDLIDIRMPELSDKKTKQMDKQFGGHYVIADLCHYYNLTNGCFTKITAVRDSVGSTGNPTYNPF